MIKPGRILIADDEETFLEAMAELLRLEGFQCDGAPDAATAAEMLKRDQYDLLIADIKMPGNTDLEFIGEVPTIAEGIPVILMTGYPSMSTAIRSVQLPVVGYLVKPVELDELLKLVRAAVKDFRAFNTVRGIRQLVQRWNDDLSGFEDVLNSASRSSASSTPVDAFLQLTFRNIISALSDLKNLSESLATDKEIKEVCHILNCPRRQRLKDALEETIEILEETRTAFKSKRLGELRKKLKLVLKSETA